MTSSYRTKQSHLEIKYTPEEYVPLLDEASDKYGSGTDDVLGSRYLISRCPFCEATHTANVDCHSIRGSWLTDANPGYYGDSFGNEKTEMIGCQHFTRVQRFLNLEGIVPVENNAIKIGFHVPFVMPFYLPNEAPSAAVIHSFPICRIEAANGLIYNFSSNRFVPPISEIKFNHDRKYIPRELRRFAEISDEDRERLKTASFVPRYTGFAVTYYALDPKPLIRKYLNSQITPEAIADRDFTMADVYYMADMEEIAYRYHEGYKLVQWVNKGKLMWLDLDSPDLPLKKESVTDFPYATVFFDVTGKYRRFRYSMGLFRW